MLSGECSSAIRSDLMVSSACDIPRAQFDGSPNKGNHRRPTQNQCQLTAWQLVIVSAGAVGVAVFDFFAGGVADVADGDVEVE